ncbi:hypothetical protein [Roseibium album]|uniref:hypothetical protein n=1 Tax=Roseibium album TaxID=311410 RepID=UPI003D9A78E5
MKAVSSVHHQERVGSEGNSGCDFIEVQQNYDGIAAGNDNSGSHAFLWAEGAEVPR